MADKKDEQPLKKLLWLDMEMTGLNDEVDVILEVALVVSDLDLNILDKYEAIVWQAPEALAGMDDWCTKTHTASGLVKLVPQGQPLSEVEIQVIDLVKKHFSKDDRVILCGNSINNDRRFIDRYMKAFAALLHYRMVDVSSYKEIFKSKFGIKFQKSNKHRAIDDIYESMEELKTYLTFVSVDNPQKIKDTCLLSPSSS